MPDYTPPTTTHLALPLPSPDAPSQRNDVERIAAALQGLDDNFAALMEALAGKAAAAHGHGPADVAGLAEALSGKAAVAHVHAPVDVVGLIEALASKAAADLSNVSTGNFAAKAASAGVGGGGVHDLVASGSITAGQVVALTTAGTVKAITSSSTATLGTEVQAATSAAGFALAHDPATGRSLLIYGDKVASNNARLHIVTCSGTGVPAVGGGTTVSGWTPSLPGKGYLINIGADRYICLYGSGSWGGEYWHARIITTTGGVIAVGQHNDVLAALGNARIVYNPAIDRVLLIHCRSNNGAGGAQPLTARVLAISGGTVTPAAATTILADDYTGFVEAYYDAGIQRIVTVWGNAPSNVTLVRGAVLAINTGDNTVTATAAATLVNGNPYTSYPLAAKYSTQAGTALVAWYVTNTQTTHVATLSATVAGAFTLGGSPAALTGGDAFQADAAFVEDLGANKMVLVGKHNQASGYVAFNAFSVSGVGVVSASKGVVKSAGVSGYTTTVFDSSSGYIITGYIIGDSPGFLLPFKGVSSDANRWVGIAKTSAADGQNVPVIGKGGMASVSGLTAGATYWVGDTGTLTTSDLGAERKVGRVVAGPKLLIEGKA